MGFVLCLENGPIIQESQESEEYQQDLQVVLGTAFGVIAIVGLIAITFLLYRIYKSRQAALSCEYCLVPFFKCSSICLSVQLFFFKNCFFVVCQIVVVLYERKLIPSSDQNNDITEAFERDTGVGKYFLTLTFVQSLIDLIVSNCCLI